MPVINAEMMEPTERALDSYKDENTVEGRFECRLELVRVEARNPECNEDTDLKATFCLVASSSCCLWGSHVSD